MSGEHPLRRKMREQAERQEAETKAEQLRKNRASQQELDARASWPKDEQALRAAIATWEEVIEEDKLPLTISYLPEPQAQGAIQRGSVQIHSKASGSSRRLQFVASMDGTLLVVLNDGKQHKFVLGQMNVAAWNGVLDQLHGLMDKPIPANVRFGSPR